jgi:polysaccharide pyruvyl transferase WcaK-like protein
MASKIVLFGMYNDPNLGDKLIFQSMSGLISGMTKDCEIEIADIYGRVALAPKTSRKKSEELAHSVNWGVINKIIHKPIGLLYKGGYNMKELAIDLEWKADPNGRRRLKKYYSEMIEGASLVIVPGGGLLENSVQHDYYHNLYLMGQLCSKKNIPLCYNAVGFVGDKRARFGTEILIKALREKSVKYLSCRDGKSQIEKYIGHEIDQTSCSAVLSSQLFGIKKDESSRRIGIGVIRENVFVSYGHPFPPDRLLSFYVGLVRTFENMGYEPLLFCNGFIQDYEFGQKVEERLGKKLLLKRPEEPRELVEQISLFKAICSPRLHAVITAYSLDIPAVTFCWGTKQKDFMRSANCPERAIEVENMTAPYAASMTREAIRYGWNEEKREENMRSAYDSVKKILKIGGIIDGE